MQTFLTRFKHANCMLIALTKIYVNLDIIWGLVNLSKDSNLPPIFDAFVMAGTNDLHDGNIDCTSIFI